MSPKSGGDTHAATEAATAKATHARLTRGDPSSGGANGMTRRNVGHRRGMATTPRNAHAAPRCTRNRSLSSVGTASGVNRRTRGPRFTLSSGLRGPRALVLTRSPQARRPPKPVPGHPTICPGTPPSCVFPRISRISRAARASQGAPPS
jgi:hypothetical protein